MNKLAVFFSYFFHPIFMLTYVTAWILFTKNYFSFFYPLNLKLLLLGMIFSFSVLLPLLNFFLMKRFKLVKDYYLTDGKERFLPLLITSFYYFGLTYLIWNFGISPIYKSVILSSAVSILISALLSIKWKLSLHTLAIGGVLGVVLFISYLLKQQNNFWISIGILLSGVIAASRLFLGVHSSKQIYVGFFLGLMTTTLVLFITLVLTVHEGI